jgi:hypothetical protein
MRQFAALALAAIGIAVAMPAAAQSIQRDWQGSYSFPDANGRQALLNQAQLIEAKKAGSFTPPVYTTNIDHINNCNNIAQSAGNTSTVKSGDDMRQVDSTQIADDTTSTAVQNCK